MLAWCLFLFWISHLTKGAFQEPNRADKNLSFHWSSLENSLSVQFLKHLIWEVMVLYHDLWKDFSLVQAAVAFRRALPFCSLSGFLCGNFILGIRTGPNGISWCHACCAFYLKHLETWLENQNPVHSYWPAGKNDTRHGIEEVVRLKHIETLDCCTFAALTFKGSSLFYKILVWKALGLCCGKKNIRWTPGKTLRNCRTRDEMVKGDFLTETSIAIVACDWWWTSYFAIRTVNIKMARSSRNRSFSSSSLITLKTTQMSFLRRSHA